MATYSCPVRPWLYFAAVLSLDQIPWGVSGHYLHRFDTTTTDVKLQYIYRILLLGKYVIHVIKWHRHEKALGQENAMAGDTKLSTKIGVEGFREKGMNTVAKTKL
jgi:hypothetical protein